MIWVFDRRSIVDDRSTVYPDPGIGSEHEPPVHLHGIRTAMSTIGKRFAQRTGDPAIAKVLDHHTKTVLNGVLREQRGKALDAYLLARAGAGRTRPR